MSAAPPVFDIGPLSELAARFSQPLQRFFRSYRLNPADAQDLTQDVFLRMAGPATPVDLRAPDAFVFTLARNLVRDRARKMKFRNAAASVSLDEIDLPNEGPSPEEELQHAERLEQAQTMLSSLKPASQEAFFPHQIHGAGYAEVAETISISVSMAEKHLMSAIAALRGIDG